MDSLTGIFPFISMRYDLNSDYPGPPNKPLIFLEKVRGFSLGVEKVSSLSLLEKIDFEV